MSVVSISPAAALPIAVCDVGCGAGAPVFPQDLAGNAKAARDLRDRN